ncbi:methyl-accepting chemotaxis protein [Geomonas sp. RF6]|uniref:methyl-accepting chemotaxis protein n=1 Tax=Geomonas sp. RF6 TaxID=2897342 RepID=UPI001E2908EE|nr:methyl-accepting chemotaxis protein [Geomonas sp. RF6]UFS70860.1 methyl-accepting chemotaxis protein [Geomonas sp. RF6]
MQLTAKVNLTVMAIFAATVTILVSVAFFSSKSILSSVIQTSQISIASDNAANLNDWIQRKLQVVEAGAKDLSRSPSPEVLKRTIKTLAAAGSFTKIHPGYEDGSVVYSDDWAPPAGYDPRERPWYRQGKKELKTGLTEPYVAASTGKLIMTFMAPINGADGKFAGIFGADVTLDHVVEQVLSVKVGKSGHAFVTDAGGKILVHPDQSLTLKKNIKDLSPDLAKSDKNFAAAATGTMTYRAGGKKKFLTYARVPSTGWYLCTTVDEDEVLAPVRKQLVTLTLIGATCLAAGLLVLVLFVNRLLKPLRELYLRVAEVADGEGDLTKRLEVGGRKDEIGQLAQKLNLFLESVRGIIVQIADASRTITSDATGLKSTAEGISLGTEQVASQTVTVATASEQMSCTAADIARNCHHAADNAARAAETTEEGFRMVKSTVDGIRKRGEETKRHAEAISSLGERSEQIGAIVATIEEIADQTNLLALNAAIEAARAGDQGRGFAVVADEVRALAERTTGATKEISTMIRTIQQETKQAIASMEEGVKGSARGVEEAAGLEDALRETLAQVESLTSQVNQIAVAAEEQTATTCSITNSIQHMTEVVNETARGSQESADTASRLSVLATEMHRTVSKFKL